MSRQAAQMVFGKSFCFASEGTVIRDGKVRAKGKGTSEGSERRKEGRMN